MQRNQNSNCQHLLDHRKSKGIKYIYFCVIDYPKVFDCMEHNKLENSLKVGITRAPYLSPKKNVCRSINNS